MGSDIPLGLTKEDVIQAITDFESGSVPHDFKDSIAYDLLHNGKRYPPKAILGLAARRANGKPLHPSDFKGGLKSKCFRILERVGFEIVPKNSMAIEKPAKVGSKSIQGALVSMVSNTRTLEKYQDYSREEVHDIFAPDTPFTPQRGSWGISGIVSIPDRPGDFVFFVTYGQKQADHEFEETITGNGVLTWQSQPSQKLADKQIQQFVGHNENQNSIYLFLRTKARTDYTYLGKLKYLSHDIERESPVHFQWQVLDWELSNLDAARIGLSLAASAEPEAATSPALSTQVKIIVEVSPPERQNKGSVKGQKTKEFKAFKNADYAEKDKRNKALGEAGESLVLQHEIDRLTQAGRLDLAAKVRHISAVEGDGAGYDILSFSEDGKVKYIEVKTTTGGANTDFFVSANELAFSSSHSDSYWLYRVYEYNLMTESGKLYVLPGNLSKSFDLEPTQFKVSR